MALSDERKRELRFAVGSKCSECGTPERILPNGKTNLHVHHTISQGSGGTDDLANLHVVCADCHHDAHHGPRKPRATRHGVRKLGSKQKILWLDAEHQQMLEELAARGNRPHTQLLLAGLRKLYESEQPGLRAEVEALRAEVAELRKRLPPPDA